VVDHHDGGSGWLQLLNKRLAGSSEGGIRFFQAEHPGSRRIAIDHHQTSRPASGLLSEGGNPFFIEVQRAAGVPQRNDRRPQPTIGSEETGRGEHPCHIPLALVRPREEHLRAWLREAPPQEGLTLAPGRDQAEEPGALARLRLSDQEMASAGQQEAGEEPLLRAQIQPVARPQRTTTAAACEPHLTEHGAELWILDARRQVPGGLSQQWEPLLPRLVQQCFSNAPELPEGGRSGELSSPACLSMIGLLGNLAEDWIIFCAVKEAAAGIPSPWWRRCLCLWHDGLSV
jgi:hypothetical protein